MTSPSEAVSSARRFCRNCGKQIEPTAVACIGCGIPPDQGASFCPSCGSTTDPRQVMCVKCGVALGARTTTGGKSKVAAGLLGIFLGGLGIHKFYLGYGKAGGIMLAIWVAGWLTGGIVSFAVAVVGLIEGIIYLTKSDEEFARIYVRSAHEWF